MNIFLIGFMGSGKSTLGRKLAPLLSLDFYDLDDLITEKEGRSVNDIFNDSGEDYFRNLERDILRLTMKKKNFILATGGGTPCFYGNMDAMNEAGLTVYLRLSPITLYERLKNEKDSRPLLNSFKPDDLSTFIQKRLNERESCYLKSELVMTESEQDPATLACLIKNYKPAGGFSF